VKLKDKLATCPKPLAAAEHPISTPNSLAAAGDQIVVAIDLSTTPNPGNGFFRAV
jgi:hypothetical protein